MGIGRPPFEEPYGFSGVHTEEYMLPTGSEHHACTERRSNMGRRPGCLGNLCGAVKMPI
jgi:hypothetical protein